MKVTTERTSKGPKLLIAVGILTALVGGFGLMGDTPWGLSILLLGGVLWAVGKVSAWFMND